jgi:hypothetical protein
MFGSGGHKGEDTRLDCMECNHHHCEEQIVKMEGTTWGKKVEHTNCDSQDRNIGGFL